MFIDVPSPPLTLFIAQNMLARSNRPMSLSTMRESRPAPMVGYSLNGLRTVDGVATWLASADRNFCWFLVRSRSEPASAYRVRTKARASWPSRVCLPFLKSAPDFGSLMSAGCPSRRRRPSPRCSRSRRSRSPRSGPGAARCCVRWCAPAARGRPPRRRRSASRAGPCPRTSSRTPEPTKLGISTSESRGSEISVDPLSPVCRIIIESVRLPRRSRCAGPSSARRSCPRGCRSRRSGSSCPRRRRAAR